MELAPGAQAAMAMAVTRMGRRTFEGDADLKDTTSEFPMVVRPPALIHRPEVQGAESPCTLPSMWRGLNQRLDDPLAGRRAREQHVLLDRVKVERIDAVRQGGVGELNVVQVVVFLAEGDARWVLARGDVADG